MSHIWQQFFDQHAPEYLDNVFTKNTVAEVEFLLELFQLPAGSAILDIGCGVGRHSIELAKRGYQMTGVDISAGMLFQARKNAEAAGVNVKWIQSDATQFKPSKTFDAAICLCEGAFGLFNVGDDPEAHSRSILANISAALKPDALFVLTTLNPFSRIRQYTPEDVSSGRFDPATMLEMQDNTLDTAGGQKMRLHFKDRRFFPSELGWMMRDVGLKVEHIWGGTAGNWGRRPIDLDEIEYMAVAKWSGKLKIDMP